MNGLYQTLDPLGLGALQLLMKAAVVVGLAWLVTLGLRRASAGARHLVWLGAVVALLALPALSYLLPSWDLKIVPAVDVTRREVGALPAGPAVMSEVEGSLGMTSEPMLPTSPAQEAIGVSTSPVPPTSERGADWLGWSILTWLTGTLLLLVRLLVGRWGLRGFARDAEPITDPEWLQLMKDVSWMLGVDRPVRLLRSGSASMPVTWGTRRPTVLLPADSSGWSMERRRVVLLHEIAHISRYDCLTQLLAGIACALYWFHPVVWIASKRLRVEREQACDDRVLAAGERASEYASHLLDVARSFRPVSPVGIAAIAMARPSQLEGRLLAVLDSARRRGMPGRRARTFGLVAAAVVIVPLAAARAVSAEVGTLPGDEVDPDARDRAEESHTPMASEPSTDSWAGMFAAPGVDVTGRASDAAVADSLFELRIAARPGDAVGLDIETGATLSIVGWDRDEVLVRAELVGEYLDEIDVALDRTTNGVRLTSRHTVDRRSRSGGHEFEIFVPSRSDLLVRSAGGRFGIRGVSGSFSGGTSGGEIVLVNVTGDADLSTAGGDIRISDADLDGEITTGGGVITMTRVRGGLESRTGGGDIIIADDLVPSTRVGAGPPRPLAFTTGGGNVEIQRASFPLDVRTGGGSIRIAAAAGELRAQTGGGTIRIGDVAGPVNASTGGGSVAIESAAGPVRVSTGSGSVHVGVPQLTAYSNIEIDSGDGAVTLVLPDDFSGVFDVQGADGRRVTTDFPVSINERGRASGQLGSGTNVVRIRARNGTVHLRRASSFRAGLDAPAAPDARPAPAPLPASSPIGPGVPAPVEVRTAVHSELPPHMEMEVHEHPFQAADFAEVALEISNVAAAQASVAVAAALNEGLRAAVEALREVEVDLNHEIEGGSRRTE